MYKTGFVLYSIRSLLLLFFSVFTSAFSRVRNQIVRFAMYFFLIIILCVVWSFKVHKNPKIISVKCLLSNKCNPLLPALADVEIRSVSNTSKFMRACQTKKWLEKTKIFWCLVIWTDLRKWINLSAPTRNVWEE